MSEVKGKETLIGKKFSRLTIVEYLGKTEGGVKWKEINHNYKCICDCGNEKITNRRNLFKNQTMSCGCLQKETMQDFWKKWKGYPPKEDNLFTRFYKRAIKLSEYRDLEFTLDKEQYRVLSFQNCHYCDEPPSNLFTYVTSGGVKGKESPRRFMGEFKYNGIDRVDNNKGYTFENCVTCCAKCNRAKRDLTYRDFLDLIKSIYKNLKLN